MRVIRIGALKSRNGNLFAISRCASSSSPIYFHSSSVIHEKPSIICEKEKNRDFGTTFEKLNSVDDAVFVFRQMVLSRPLPSDIVFSKLIRVLVSMKHYFTVVSFFREMRELNIPVNEYILNMVINCYCLLNRSDYGFALLCVFFKSGIPFNVVTFNTLIKGFFHGNKAQHALDLFDKLVRDDICELNVVMYGTIMNGLCKLGHTQKALRLLELMERGTTKPNNVVYSTLIDSLCKDGMVDDALNLFDQMKQKGIHPNVILYTSMIDGLCKFGQWGRARLLIDEMVHLDFCPNVHTFTIIIDALCKEGRVEDAEEVMQVMVRRGVEPDVVTYNALMDGYCLRLQMDAAKRIMDSMMHKGIEPSILSYSIMINGYC